MVSSPTLYQAGSPPHTWRKPQKQWGRLQKVGITSTYVEKTKILMYCDENKRDHLHIRGENQMYGTQVVDEPGSPPHTWRKQINSVVDLSSLRITSTYVEKTQ